MGTNNDLYVYIIERTMAMRNPNGYGSVYKLSGKRRKPFVARKTNGFDDRGYPIYEIVGYYADRKEAIMALAAYNKNPLMIDSSQITFQEVFDLWKKQKYDSASATTVNGYNAAFKNSPSLHKMKFQDIKTLHMDDAILNCSLRLGSLRKMKILYQQLYAYAMANDIVAKNYADYVKLPDREENVTREIFTKSEIDKLFAVADTMPYVDSILTLIYTGLRPGEMLNLALDDINLKEMYFVVTKSKTEAGRGRAVPINEKLKPFFEKRFQDNKAYLFEHKGKKITYSYYYRSIFTPLMEELGLNVKHRPHDCRHTFATLLNNAGANKTSIKDIIGHSTVAMHEKVYTHKDIEELRKAIDLV